MPLSKIILVQSVNDVNLVRFPDTCLVLLGHGAPGASDPLWSHAEPLKKRNLANVVLVSYWRQEPFISDILKQELPRQIIIVPFFTTEGFLVDNQIPLALGFHEKGKNIFLRKIQDQGRCLYYCRPVGSHPMVAGIIARHAESIKTSRKNAPTQQNFKEMTLLLVAHGTKKDSRSSAAIKCHADAIRQNNCFADVLCCFLEEEPQIKDCLRSAQSSHLLVLPFFMNNGPHVLNDIPGALNFTLNDEEKAHLISNGMTFVHRMIDGRSIWLSSALGNFPDMSDVIVERAMEAYASLSPIIEFSALPQ